MIVSRLAPTPSGYLHLGNIANFLLTQDFVRKKRGELWLRLDDCDGSRVRDEFIEDVFTTLNWLGIRWDRGPQNITDFKENFSQLAHKNYYWSELSKLPTFVCTCSRKSIRERVGNLDYDGFCSHQNRSFVRGESCIRLNISPYPILWTRDDNPAYNLVSVCDDISMGVTDIIRGEDLRLLTSVQSLLFGKWQKTIPHFHFHKLVLDRDGNKLSKSNLSTSIRSYRLQGESPNDLKKVFSIIALEDF
jgi:glutamyl-tRNA synthetase